MSHRPPRPPARPRALAPVDSAHARPVYVVWELTMRCDQACDHCGSRAGPGLARPDELDDATLFDVADAIAELGCGEVTLIGGEAYLHPRVEAIIERLASQGVAVTMQSGGRGLNRHRCDRLRARGLRGLGVSIDGPEAIHDRLRANRGSYRAALRAIDEAQAAGLTVTSNMQICRLNADPEVLREHAKVMQAHGVRVWKTQLTAPMGRAADRPEWLLEPHRIVDVIETLADIQMEALADAEAKGVSPKSAFVVEAGNSIGYFGPHEMLLRSRPGFAEHYWQGCQAGRHVLGIESDGTVKACPSLPTAPYASGNLRDRSLHSLWHGDDGVLGFARRERVDELWGFCAQCRYGPTCGAGCSFMAHTLLGRRGNNPYCWYRVKQLERQGLRERLQAVERAAGQPYDFGRLELVLEPIEGASERALVERKRLPILA